MVAISRVAQLEGATFLTACIFKFGTMVANKGLRSHRDQLSRERSDENSQ